MVVCAGTSSANLPCLDYPDTRSRYAKIWPHNHSNISYSVSGNTLTGTCSETNCNFVNNQFTLLVNADDAVYDGNPHGGTLATGNLLHGLTEIKEITGLTLADSDITFWQGETKLSGVPVNVGVYTAKLTVNLDGTDYTIFKEYNIKPTVTYDANGGTGAPVDSNSPYLPNATVTVLEPGEMAYSGFTFAGWNTAENGTGTEYVPGDTFTVSESTILYAQWGYCVTITAGSGMIKTTASGDATQTIVAGAAMTDVVYTANEGYYFPTDYNVSSVNGISVTRDSYTQITVSGTPTADAAIALTAPTAKTTPDAPTTAAATDCTTADNNDGTLTGVTTEMEYKQSDAESWTAGTVSDITGLVPGTYYVRYKATDTTNASDNQVLTVAGYTAPVHTHDGVTFEPWTSTSSLPTSGNYYLTEDVTVSTKTTVSSTSALNLCLNGYGIRMTGDDSVFQVNTGGTMNLYDFNESNSTHYVTLTNWRGTAVSDTGSASEVTDGNGVVNLNGGLITGGYNTNPGGGAFCVYGTFNMYGGTLLGNYAKSGGAIWTSGSTTIADGSRIAYNKGAEGNRGGVYVSGGEFHISGAPDLTGNSGSNIVLNGTDRKIDFTSFDPNVRIGAIYYTGNPDNFVFTTNAQFTSDDAVKAVFTPTSTEKNVFMLNGQAWFGTPYSVTLNPTEAQTINLSGTTSFTATIGPENATDKKVIWSVGGDNAGAVTLYTDENCTEGSEVGTEATETLTVYAKGVSAGTATVTVTSNTDRTKIASCDVTVSKANSTSATVTANDRAADGTAQPLVNVDDGTLVGGTMQYALGTDDTTAPTTGWDTAIPTATDAGTYYVWYQVVGDNNHHNTKPACVTVTLARQCTVTFDSNGGALTGDQTQIVIEGEKATEPAAPTKTGSTFAGWFTDTGCTIPYDFDEPVNANLTLYAGWAVTPPGINCTYSLSLNDSIDLNIYVAGVPQSDLDSYSVQYKFGNGATVEKAMSDGEASGNKRKFTVAHCTASQMTDTVSLSVLQNGTSVYDMPARSIQTYCATVLDGTYDATFKELCQSVLDYGAYAQHHFEGVAVGSAASANNGHTRASDIVKENWTAGEAVDAYLGENYVSVPTADWLEKITYSLSLESRTEMNFYVYQKNNDALTVTGAKLGDTTLDAGQIVCDSVTVNGYTEGTVYRVKVKGIAAQDLDKVIELTLKNGDSDAKTLKFSPMTYVAKAQTLGTETNKLVCRALYLYTKAAKAYKS